MHTTNWDDEAEWGQIPMHHNGDFSGDVQFVLPTGVAQPEYSGDRVIIKLPFDALRSLVAEYVRFARMEELEDAEDDELLGVKIRR